MLQNIILRNYRSYNELSIDFAHNTNVIIGLNGAGKTNILEAVLVAYIGKSYRTNDQYLIKYEKQSAKISITESDKKRQVLLDKKIDSKIDKTFILSQNKSKRLTFQNSLPVVLFEPEFMQIIVRGPDSRRDYFDDILSRTLPTYQTQLNTYKRILAQRNALLKQNPTTDSLFVWDIKLSQSGGLIALKRQQLLSKINQKINSIYSDLSSSSYDIRLEYLSKQSEKNYTDNLLHNLQKNTKTDSERGFTSVGPHRDDIAFYINNQEASLSASRGETRTLLLALKIFETQLIEVIRGKKPLLLLDDVFSELDENRQTKLIDYFKDNQVIITTTNITPLMKGISGKIIEL